MTEAQKEAIAAELNALSLAIAEQGVQRIEELQQRYPALIALDLVVQAMMTATVSLLKTGEAIGLPINPEISARACLANVLSLRVKHHERHPDGSLGPGQSFN